MLSGAYQLGSASNVRTVNKQAFIQVRDIPQNSIVVYTRDPAVASTAASVTENFQPTSWLRAELIPNTNTANLPSIKTDPELSATGEPNPEWPDRTHHDEEYTYTALAVKAGWGVSHVVQAKVKVLMQLGTVTVCGGVHRGVTGSCNTLHLDFTSTSSTAFYVRHVLPSWMQGLADLTVMYTSRYVPFGGTAPAFPAYQVLGTGNELAVSATGQHTYKMYASKSGYVQSAETTVTFTVRESLADPVVSLDYLAAEGGRVLRYDDSTERHTVAADATSGSLVKLKLATAQLGANIHFTEGYCSSFSGSPTSCNAPSEITTVIRSGYWYENGCLEAGNTVVAPEAGNTYNEVASKHCALNKIDTAYGSLQSAMAACDSNSVCTGVYDSGCDGSDGYYMCDVAAANYMTSSGGSCVHEKQLGTAQTARFCSCSRPSESNITNATTRSFPTVTNTSVMIMNATACSGTVQAQSWEYTEGKVSTVRHVSSGQCLDHQNIFSSLPSARHLVLTTCSEEVGEWFVNTEAEQLNNTYGSFSPYGLYYFPARRRRSTLLQGGTHGGSRVALYELVPWYFTAGAAVTYDLGSDPNSQRLQWGPTSFVSRSSPECREVAFSHPGQHRFCVYASATGFLDSTKREYLLAVAQRCPPSLRFFCFLGSPRVLIIS